MKRSDMVLEGAAHLKKAETAVEMALMEVALLTGNLSSIRMRGNQSLVVGNDAFKALSRSVASLFAAREAMVDTHAELAKVKDKMGCGAVAVGTLGDKSGPDVPATGFVEDDRNIRAVA